MSEPRVELSALAASSPFPNTFREGVRAAVSVIEQHVPSLTDYNESEIQGIMLGIRLIGEEKPEEENWDVADLAVRTCRCGKRIDGFYEYVDHLKEVLTA